MVSKSCGTRKALISFWNICNKFRFIRSIWNVESDYCCGPWALFSCEVYCQKLMVLIYLVILSFVPHELYWNWFILNVGWSRIFFNTMWIFQEHKETGWIWRLYHECVKTFWFYVHIPVEKKRMGKWSSIFP